MQAIEIWRCLATLPRTNNGEAVVAIIMIHQCRKAWTRCRRREIPDHSDSLDIVVMTTQKIKYVFRYVEYI